jgi:asparagine synthase (glutamine-hydrolysing)
MCGISGALSSRPIKLRSLVMMNEIIKHRGPDDEGFVLFDSSSFQVLGGSDTTGDAWSSNIIYTPRVDINESSFKGNVGLGHRRLSILDLSVKGHQPMSSNDERYWITFNGEIYNYLEIRSELISLGHSFNTDTDTEVVLSAYHEWGEECQNRFNGMWAFAIYDRQQNLIFLSRDRFGIKPLYYWYSPQGDFYFASEIKQFTVLPGWRAILNMKRASDYLFDALTDHTDETLFTGVYMIPPSNYVLDSIETILSYKSKLKTQRWYTPTISKFKLSFEDAKNEFLAKFKESVSLHLRADVPVGSALSGGLDSSSIVSYINVLLKQEGRTGLQKTFSSCSLDPRFDERIWMEEVVKETKVDGHFIYPKGEDVFSLTEKLIWYMDEPYNSQSVFMGYHVFDEARKSNIKVLLNGQGADEYLSGYGAFRDLRLKKLIYGFNVSGIIHELHDYKKIIKVIVEIIAPWFIKYRNKRRALKKRYIDNSVLTYKNTTIALNTLKEISDQQLYVDPLPKFLRWEDRNSMAHSIEARVPFLEYRLIEYVQSLPIEYLDSPNSSKRILVEALKGILPEKVRNRKDKKGFITPEERWFKQDFGQRYLDMFLSVAKYSKGIIIEKEAKIYLDKMQKGEIKFDYSYWHMILFCIWMKRFNVELS